jgi:hypothetical protein
LWGKVIEGSWGYRAEYARPLAVVTVTDLYPSRCKFPLSGLPAVPARELGIGRRIVEQLTDFAKKCEVLC